MCKFMWLMLGVVGGMVLAIMTGFIEAHFDLEKTKFSDWCTLALAFATFILLYFTFLINKDQQKQNKFDRWKPIYDAAMEFIFSTQQSYAKKEIPNEYELDKYCSYIKEIQWIQNPEIKDNLFKLINIFYELKHVSEMLKIEHLTCPEKEKYDSEREKIKTQLDKVKQNLDFLFEKFLRPYKLSSMVS